MRNPDRIWQIIDMLEEIWENNPDLRLGQIIENARVFSGFAGDLFNIEDDDLVTGLILLKEPPK